MQGAVQDCCLVINDTVHRSGAEPASTSRGSADLWREAAGRSQTQCAPLQSGAGHAPGE
jgi:hypothetical protein